MGLKYTTMKYLLVTIISLSFLINTSYAQNDSTATTPKFKHAIGVTAGFTIGNGLSYRHSFNKFEIQGSFAPFKDEFSSKYSVGATFIYKLVETPKVIFLLYQGNQYIYKEDMEYSWDINGNQLSEDKVIESYVNNGIGIGVRFIILKRVGLDIMGGYASYDNYSRISFTGEIGLFFMF